MKESTRTQCVWLRHTWNMDGSIQMSTGLFIDLVVRCIEVKPSSNAFGKHSEECFDATGVVSIGGKSIPVQTAYRGGVLVWEPQDGRPIAVLQGGI
jgi:hypothetical protein